MNIIRTLIFLVIVLTFWGCNENATDVKQDNTPRLVLTANKTSGTAPLDVTVTGQFLGKIDTIPMLVPDYILYPSEGKTIIRYALPDTIQPAKASYSENRTLKVKGIYKFFMVLQGKHKDYLSDSLTIIVD